MSSLWPFEVVVINGAAKQKGHQSREVPWLGGGVGGSSTVTTSTSTSTAATVVAVAVAVAVATATAPEPDLNGKQESHRRFVCHHLPAALEG